MIARAVTNSTCLITLHRIGRIEILQASFPEVHAPRAVLDEFGEELPWIIPRIPENSNLVRALELQVDHGEAEAIAVAVETADAVVVLDDKKARRIAMAMRLQVIGTVGMLLRAKRLALIPSVRPILEALKEAGFHMSVQLLQEALRLARE